MARIKTFVIFDMETTGLPYQEQNLTKATEMCFVAVSRRDLKRTRQGGVISASKLSFMLNPGRAISAGAIAINGISNDILKFTSTFVQKIPGIIQFLDELPKPVCLVAHNGNAFDYKVLNAECNDIQSWLPEDILCVDSLQAFRQIEKQYQKRSSQGMSRFLEGMFTDDEEDDEEECDILRQKAPQTDFKLQSVYERLYGTKGSNAHGAEVDCQMLLDCVIAYQSNNSDFVGWADQNCKLLSNIKSLQRPWYQKRDIY